MNRARRLLAVALVALLAACGETGPQTAPTPTAADQQTPAAQQTPTPQPPGTTAPGTTTPTPGATAPAPDATALPAVPVDLREPDGTTAERFVAEIAADPASRQTGLMHREHLADDAGMLFLFPGDHEGGFWMKDTLIPLTIAFAQADGTIVAVLDMEPCEADPCPSYRPGAPYRMALEVNQGALGDAEPGWQLSIDGQVPPIS